jgi:hypothetical protein
MEGRFGAHGVFDFFFENQLSKFHFLKTIQDVASDIYHKLTNYQLQIMHILSYMKMTKVWIRVSHF